MRISKITPEIVFGKSQADKTEKQKKKYVDPLTNFPLRALGYTNDIGVAINELAPNLARLFWVPALMYFGADVYDKYKNKGNKYDPNAQRAFSQATFQAFASIIFPTIVGHVGQSGFSLLEKANKNKISTNAKEQVFRFIKGHGSAHNLFRGDKDKETLIERFSSEFQDFCTSRRDAYAKKNIFAKMYDAMLANCKIGAFHHSKQENISKYAMQEFEALLEQCKNTGELEAMIDKRIFKLKAWKSFGAFVALALAVKPIDNFTENVIVKKCVEPQIKKISQTQINMSDFLNMNKS